MKIYFYSVLLILSLHFQVGSLILNRRPIIGILTHELSSTNQIRYPTKSSYIAASYVKFVEGSGGRAIPIFIGRDGKYYENTLKKINGVLFPGGNSNFTASNGYKDAGKKIYKLVTEMNCKGIYMPIWATSLGFEFLTYVSINNDTILTSCNALHQANPLKFSEGFESSRLFENIPEDIKNTLQNTKATTNIHKVCVTKCNFETYRLNNIWNVLATSEDADGNEYIAAIEHKQYPIYGVHFHPEKNIYEFKKRNMNHKPDAIAASQYFANFFVNECRKNDNSFNSDQDEEQYLMYNYCPTYTGKTGSDFQQTYFF